MKPSAYLIDSPFGTHIAALTPEGWPSETVTPCYSGEQIRDVLAPFAALYSSHHEHMPDDYIIFQINHAQITVGDLRRASNALS